MNYINPNTLAVVSLQAIREANPQMSIPDGADLSDLGCEKLVETPRPEHPEWWTADDAPPENESGVWRTAWAVREMTVEEKAARAVQLIAELEEASGSPQRIVREGLILLIESQAVAQGVTLAYLRSKNKGYRLLKECDEQITTLRKFIP